MKRDRVKIDPRAVTVYKELPESPRSAVYKELRESDIEDYSLYTWHDDTQWVAVYWPDMAERA